jgi:hypothetical protein
MNMAGIEEEQRATRDRVFAMISAIEPMITLSGGRISVQEVDQAVLDNDRSVADELLSSLDSANDLAQADNVDVALFAISTDLGNANA